MFQLESLSLSPTISLSPSRDGSALSLSLAIFLSLVVSLALGWSQSLDNCLSLPDSIHCLSHSFCLSHPALSRPPPHAMTLSHSSSLSLVDLFSLPEVLVYPLMHSLFLPLPFTPLLSHSFIRLLTRCPSHSLIVSTSTYGSLLLFFSLTGGCVSLPYSLSLSHTLSHEPWPHIQPRVRERPCMGLHTQQL